MKLLLIVCCLFTFTNCLVFIKILKHKDYPGQCYPVHYRVGKKMKYDLFALFPGESKRDDNVCGMTVCMNADGLTYVYHCPQTIPSSECQEPDMLNTRIPFPQCCWQCSLSRICSKLEIFPQFPYPPTTKKPKNGTLGIARAADEKRDEATGSDPILTAAP
ncbi:uncharacterized protein LOC115631316 [Scaptodrosophila lebanonensis]|uniref:Uncharacterized protein LOC115631316 n=1 Tax=Drosophila lebanonensis TaxID=7225 RepID=A0A6J2U5P9_DROLE|nr:uncharacterized protein LOC115631316 [Scaptodrosophila lebanonensis]